jgi:hypothetical protein
MRMRSKNLLLALMLASTAVLASCGGKSINHVLADPSRYRNQEVKVSGTVLDSYSIASRGVYHLDDSTGKLWVYSDNGVPRKDSRVTVWGTVREGFSLGALNNLIKLPVDAVILVEREHRAK